MITLDNVHAFSVPLSEHPLKWVFLVENKPLSDEFQDQIIPLMPEASKFLWNFMNTQRYFGSILSMQKYFNVQSELSCVENDSPTVEKWLYERGIPFDLKVFWITQQEWGFILTWKMVIKFSKKLFFANDQLIWDRTLNWALMYEHNDIFHFGKNRNFNAERNSEEIARITKAINDSKKNEST